MNGFKEETSRTRQNTRIDCDKQLSEDDISHSLSKADTISDKGETIWAHSTQWTVAKETSYRQTPNNGLTVLKLDLVHL
jgi:hypothetical protein